MKRIITYIVLALAVLPLSAQSFDKYFNNETLRLDYIFAGNQKEQMLYLDKLNCIPGWFGKRQHLSEVPVRGNGQIIVRDHKTGDVIYRQSFSTLFQEWLSYDESKTQQRSFENCYLMPMPKDTCDVTVEIYNNRQETISKMTHLVVPTDILIRRVGEKPENYVTLLKAKDFDHSVKIAFVAEGYKKEEMQLFIDSCKVAMEAMFSHEPFKSMKDCFNIIAVESPSEDSGTSEPGNHVWRNTVLGSHFDTFYSDRYLTTLNLKQLHDVLAGTPYEHIIVLVNTSKYGGGGILNSYNLSMANHRLFRQVVVHEFGHSFAGLADEYAYDFEQIPMYPHDIEPWEPNITTKVDFASKWQDMIGTQEFRNQGNTEVGLHEGAGYSVKGVYRPCDDCRMRTNNVPYFCPVCQRAIKKVIEFYSSGY